MNIKLDDLLAIKDRVEFLEFNLNKMTNDNRKMIIKEYYPDFKPRKLKKADFIDIIIDIIDQNSNEQLKLTYYEVMMKAEESINKLSLPSPVDTSKNDNGFYFDEIYCTSIKGLKYAYRIMCDKYHPDKGGNSKVFNEINEEYEFRKKYVGMDGNEISDEMFRIYLDIAIENPGEFESKIIKDMTKIACRHHGVRISDGSWRNKKINFGKEELKKFKQKMRKERENRENEKNSN